MTCRLDLLMFAVLIGGDPAGFPGRRSRSPGVATLFALLGAATGGCDLGLLGALGQRIFGVITNDVLIAIPLFVLMGVVLEKSRIAEDLLETMAGCSAGARRARRLGGAGRRAAGRLDGYRRRDRHRDGADRAADHAAQGYDPRLAAGMVCTAGTLGQIIPPSTLLIILSDVMSNAYQQAQFAQGKFTIDTISVGQIFAAALLPGLRWSASTSSISWRAAG